MAETVIILVLVAIGGFKLWKDLTAKGEESWFNQEGTGNLIGKIATCVVGGFFYMIVAIVKFSYRFVMLMFR